MVIQRSACMPAQSDELMTTPLCPGKGLLYAGISVDRHIQMLQTGIAFATASSHRWRTFLPSSDAPGKACIARKAQADALHTRCGCGSNFTDKGKCVSHWHEMDCCCRMERVMRQLRMVNHLQQRPSGRSEDLTSRDGDNFKRWVPPYMAWQRQFSPWSLNTIQVSRASLLQFRLFVSQQVFMDAVAEQVYVCSGLRSLQGLCLFHLIAQLAISCHLQCSSLPTAPDLRCVLARLVLPMAGGT